MAISLPDFLDANRDALVECWIRRAEEAVAPREVSREDLIDSLPLLLKEIVEVLRHEAELPGGSRLPCDSKVAGEHGKQRLRLGFDMVVVIQEYAILRDCLLEALEEAGFELTARLVRLLSQCIDMGTTEAVSQYLKEGQRLEQRERGARVDAQARQAFAESELADVRRAEAALRVSEERFRLMVESVQDYGVFMVSLEGVVEGWNTGAERLKGYRAEEIIGSPISLFFPRQEVEAGTPERLVREAVLEGKSNYEGWLVRKSGETFWGTVALGAVRDEEGHLRGISNVARDLTERKRIEQAQAFLSQVGEVLAGSLDYQTTLQEVARLATQGLGDGCMVHVVEGDTLRPRSVAYADADKERLARTAARGVPSVPRVPHGVAHVVSTGQAELCPDVSESAWAGEALGVEPAQVLQELGVHSCMCVPLKVRGKTFGAMTFISTASNRRYGLADLSLAEELARRAALALDNARLYGEVLERAEFEQHLAGIVSHDLSTPIQAISMSAELLLREKDLNEQQFKKLHRIRASVERTKRMTHDLLDFTKARLGGGLQVHPQPLDLHVFTRQVVDELATAHPERQVEMAHSGDARGDWDPDRMAQVITNLVNNALRYSPSNSPVRVETRGEDEAVLLRVHNGGAPIPPRSLSRIFEPLERGAQPGNEGHGIGLGLFIVGHIVRAHGGSVEVHSTQEEGTTFTVRLPRPAS
ncbi:ATP-binding protein [Archangium sp.]|uniref:ATP-binding protein n=1 Tax=Archangium sp. TaxID=1872627 RepID=UPI002D34226B|nr:ATP-binding protein [Archangium sp.]HYO56679.1 ATP-binding protein [Archangium sp.]